MKMKIRQLSIIAVVAFGIGLCTGASAVTLTADYSGLGTVYQDASGNLYTTAGAGRTDVTNIFKSDISTAIGYLQSAVLVPWNETISFSLANLSSACGGSPAVGCSTFVSTNVDANGRPTSSSIQFNGDNTTDPSAFFVDATPTDNSEFTMGSSSAALGGGNVNVSQFGNAPGSSAANGKWDFLTVAIHEIEHSIGYASALARFTNVAGATGSSNRKITVPTSLSGLANSFDIPIVSGSAHIDGTTQSGLFNNTVVADPGFGVSQRALPTSVDIYGLCVIEGCAANQINPNTVPLPGSFVLLLSGMLGLVMRNARRLCR